jgi:DNA segregation ATPase FtsK/SpoIIIE, S-DNA-T family
MDPGGILENIFEAILHTVEGLLAALARALWSLVCVLGVLAWKLIRYLVGGVGSKPRNEFAKALALCNLTEEVPCRVTGHKLTPFGETYRILIDGGKTAGPLRDKHESLASAFGCLKVEIEQSKKSAREAYVHVLRRDPLATPMECPWAATRDVAKFPSIRNGIPVGVDRYGEEEILKLLYNNFLIGGEPGGGKSVLMGILVAAAIFDPECSVYLLDFKGTDLGPWAPAAERFADRDITEVLSLLEEVSAVMYERLEQMKASGKRKFLITQGYILLAIDELASYMKWPDKEERDKFSELLHNLVQMGRGVGVMVVAATQYPHHENIPTTLRNLFSYRAALRCVVPVASDVVLKPGMAKLGFDASTIEPEHKGKGFLLHEESLPKSVRFYNLDDPLFDALVAMARSMASTGLPGASQPHLTLVPTPSDARTDDQTGQYPPETPLHRLNGGLTSFGKEADQSSAPGLPPVSISPSSPSIPHPPAGPAPLPPDPLLDLLRVLASEDLKLLYSMSKLHDLPEGWCSPRVYQVLRAQRYGDALSADQQMKRWMRAKGDGITGKNAKPGLKLVEQRPHDPTKGAASPLEYRLTSLGWQLVGRIRMPETEGADA